MKNFRAQGISTTFNSNSPGLYNDPGFELNLTSGKSPNEGVTQECPLSPTLTYK